MDRKAFTLIEMVIALILVSVLAFSVTYIFMEGFRSYIMNRNLIFLRSEVRMALKRMAFEIREAESQSVTSSTDFIINADIDDDGITEAVRYYLDGNNLRRQVDGAPDPGRILLGNIDSPNTNFMASGTNSIILNITVLKMDDSVHVMTRVRGRNI